MSAEGFEYFEVVADVGVRGWAPDLPGCFRQVALGVVNLVVPLELVLPAESREVSAQGESLEALLAGWINEILFLQDVEGFAVREVARPDILGRRIHAELQGERLDPTRHAGGTVVKAATFHQLAVVQEPGRVTARLILDI